MKAPVLKIDGNTYEMARPTMKMWREMTKLEDKDEKDASLNDIVSARARILALVYGLDAETVDEIDLADVIPAYKAAVKYVIENIFSKLEDVPKNGETAKQE
jgi:hypothetical protein